MARGGAVVTSRWPSSHTFQIYNRQFLELTPLPSCSKQSIGTRSNRLKKAWLRFSFWAGVSGQLRSWGELHNVRLRW
jgi:hypothetical protein